MNETFVQAMRREGRAEPIIIDFIELISKSTDTRSILKTIDAFFLLSSDKQRLVLSGIIGLMSGIMVTVDAGMMDTKGELNYESDSNN